MFFHRANCKADFNSELLPCINKFKMKFNENDPSVLFCCLVFCSVSSSVNVVRPNRSQVVRIELPCISVS